MKNPTSCVNVYPFSAHIRYAIFSVAKRRGCVINTLVFGFNFTIHDGTTVDLPQPVYPITIIVLKRSKYSLNTSWFLTS